MRDVVVLALTAASFLVGVAVCTRVLASGAVSQGSGR